MATPRSVIDASSPALPESATSVSVPNAGALTSAAVIDLSSHVNKFVTFYGTGGVYRIRASATRVDAQTSAAATAGSLPFEADRGHPFKVKKTGQYVSVYGDAAVTLIWAVTS